MRRAHIGHTQPTNNAVRRDASLLECSGDFHHGLLSVRAFLRLALPASPPDHSTISRTRRLFSVEAHQAVFRWVLQQLAESSLVTGKTLGIDATTLEQSEVEVLGFQMAG